MIDVTISGQWGLYQIQPLSKSGQKWVRKHLSKNSIKLHDSIVCEGSDRCREIVAAMDLAKLCVEVNGVNMKGFGVNA